MRSANNESGVFVAVDVCMVMMSSHVLPQNERTELSFSTDDIDDNQKGTTQHHGKTIV